MSLELLPLVLGEVLLPLALPEPEVLPLALPDPLLDWSLEVLGALPEVLGVLPEPDALELELGLEDEPELGVEDDELELGELELGVDADPDIEDEPEDDGLDGEVLDEDEPAEDLSPPRDAPGPPALSQPYRPLTATAIGTRINADFFSKLIGVLLSWVGG